MENELKACPFCGEFEGKLVECEDYDGFSAGYRVRCGYCDAQGALGDREYAVKEWNTRTEPKVN